MFHVSVWSFRAGCVRTAILLAASLPASMAVAEEEASLMAKLYWDRSVLRAERDEIHWLYVEDVGNVRPSLTVKLKTPAGVDLLNDATRKIPASAWEQQLVYIGGRRKAPSVMEPHPAAQISWRLRSDQPLSGEIEVAVSGDGLAASDALVAVFREALAFVKAPYVPEPRAVDSERHVGMIYCPLWKPGDHYGWHMMARSMPWRKPALGWYDESLAPRFERATQYPARSLVRSLVPSVPCPFLLGWIAIRRSTQLVGSPFGLQPTGKRTNDEKDPRDQSDKGPRGPPELTIHGGYYRLSPRRLAECERRRTTINGRAEPDACDIEKVGKDKPHLPRSPSSFATPTVDHLLRAVEFAKLDSASSCQSWVGSVS